MGNWAYLSLDKLKADLPSGVGTTYDTPLRRALETASQQIDRWCERTFRVLVATRYFTAVYGDRLELDADLLAVTTLRGLTLNSSGTRTYGDLWAAVDYDLHPDNAVADRRPYTSIRRNPQGAYVFPINQIGVQLVGKWGYWEDLETLTSTLTSGVNGSVTTLPITSGTEADVCDTLLIDSEQVYVTAISTNNLTVVRGVNGTTAAAHLSGAAIQRYLYPDDIAQACGMQAARLFNRARNSPTGVTGSADVGFIRPVRLDADVRALIEPYRDLRA